MGISWTTALGSLDDSLESQMAQRDLSKFELMMQQLGQDQERKRSNQQRERLEQEQMAQQAEQIRESRAERLANQAELKRRSEVDDERQKFGAIPLAPGYATDDPDTLSLAKKYGANDWTPDEGPVSEGSRQRFVYQRRQHEDALHKLQQQELRQEEDRKYRESDEKRRESEEGRQRKEFDLKTRAADDLHKKRTEAASNAGKLLSKIPPELRQSFNKRVQEIYSSGQTINPFDTEEGNQLTATKQAYEEFTKAFPQQVQPVTSGLPTKTPPSNVPAQGQGEFLSDQEVQALGLVVPPGFKVRRPK